MPMFNKILFATDFSPESRRALGCAVELAVRLGTPLLILSIVQIPAYPLPEGMLVRGPEAMSDLVTHVQDALEGERLTAANLGAVDVETLWLEGAAAAEIVRVASERAIDLIVVGSHGRGGLTRAIVGSTADKIVRSAHCPVMVVAHEPPSAAH